MSKLDRISRERVKSPDFAQPKAETNPLKVTGVLLLVILVLLIAYRCGG